MLKKSLVITFFFILSAILAYVYFTYRLPEGLTSQGDDSEMVAFLALATSVVTLLTAIVGLIQKIIEKK